MKRTLKTCLASMLPLALLWAAPVKADGGFAQRPTLRLPGEPGDPGDPGPEPEPEPEPEPDNDCGNAGLNPRVFATEVVGPLALMPGGIAPSPWNPLSGRLSRAGIHYVSGGSLKVRVVADQCTEVRGVRFGSRTVTTANNGGYWYYREATTQPSDPMQWAHGVVVQFPYLGDGSTEPVTLLVGRAGSDRYLATSVPVTRVASVEARDVRASIGVSRAELHNMFGRALFAKFGPTNSTVITQADGSQRRIYGYDPSTLSVSVTSTGVSFQFKFKIDINNYCDPTVRAYGTFKLGATFSGITVDWVNPAQGSADWPFLCEWAQLIPGIGLIPYLVAEQAVEAESGSSVRAIVEASVASALPNSGTANLFLDGSTTRNNELLVHIKLPVPSIRIQAPYDAFDQNRPGTLFPEGEKLTLIASGLGMNDFIAGAVPATTLHSGPNGVPRAGTATWPSAWTVARSGNLVWNAAPVARILARMVEPLRSTTYQYEPGCTVHLPQSPWSYVGPAWVRFAVNDTAQDAQRLRALSAAPGYSLRVFFSSDLGAASAPSCSFFTTGPVASPALTATTP